MSATPGPRWGGRSLGASLAAHDRAHEDTAQERETLVEFVEEAATIVTQDLAPEIDGFDTTLAFDGTRLDNLETVTIVTPATARCVEFQWAGDDASDPELPCDDCGVKQRSHPTLAARPTRFHANAKGDHPERRFDTTALHGDVHGKMISHADYIAHSEKYDYVWRSIKNGDRILDVGCGTDLPLANRIGYGEEPDNLADRPALMDAVIYAHSQAAKLLHREGGGYVGVDLNKLKSTRVAWATLLGETDITSDVGFQAAVDATPTTEDGEKNVGYTLIVCLEVIEHMGDADQRQLLVRMRDLLADDGRIILSTPVYDGKAMARNHIRELTVDELADMIASVGLTVVKRMGTFTAEPVIKRWLKTNRPDWYKLYMEAREFHSAGYMSGVIAPMVPDLSRNNVWDIRRT